MLPAALSPPPPSSSSSSSSSSSALPLAVVLTLLALPAAPALCARLPATPLKKDVFSSRGWGAGGMPFSVLYLHQQQQQQQQQQLQAQMQAQQQVLQQQQARVQAQQINVPAPPRALAQRHALPPPGVEEAPLRTPARRHYSIIPQLFVSYGWGPLGK